MTTRRTLLQAGLLGAGLSQVPFTATAASASVAADASAVGSPDVDDPRFTLAVIPDTQYLFDQDRGDSAPLVATMKYLLENRRSENIVFTAHLGDVVENALASEFAQVDPVFRLLDNHRAPYSVLAGNHDIDSRTNDQRGDSPYLRTFGPDRFRRMPTYGGTSPGGYNSWHVFRGGGRQWLLLAMDWRPSDEGFAWARKVIADHPRLPVILTTHDLVYADAGPAELSEHGKRVWEQLVDGNDQIFLTLNGHFWPSGRVVKQNAARNDVHLHITNYQDRYYGGSGMIRLYHFDLARNIIDVVTISPGSWPNRCHGVRRWSRARSSSPTTRTASACRSTSTSASRVSPRSPYGLRARPPGWWCPGRSRIGGSTVRRWIGWSTTPGRATTSRPYCCQPMAGRCRRTSITRISLGMGAGCSVVANGLRAAGTCVRRTTRRSTR